MREDNGYRLDNYDIGIGHSLYLHYTFYHQDLFKAIQSFAKGKLLDIGCGNKPYQSIIENYVTAYIGCDVIQSSAKKVDVICDATRIPLEDDAFDTILSTQTLEHVENPQGLIYEAFRLLKVGGYFILSAPMYWPLHEEPYDFYRYTKHGLQYLFEQAGFSVIEIHANGGKWATAGQALIHAVYPTLYNIKGFKGKMIKILFKLLGGVKTINRVFAGLDRKYPDHVNPMNYVFIGQKKA